MPERFRISFDFEGGELPPEERTTWWDDRLLWLSARRSFIKDNKPYYESFHIAFAPDDSKPTIIKYLRTKALEERETNPIYANYYLDMANQLENSDSGEDVPADMPTL